MRMCFLWTSALRCWINLLPLLLLAACSTPRGLHGQGPAGTPVEPPRQSALCEQYVTAWVGHFRANVARLDGAEQRLGVAALERSRQALQVAGIDERSCERPFCIIQPQSGGRLNSYCGYRIASDAPGELYRWVPWTPGAR